MCRANAAVVTHSPRNDIQHGQHTVHLVRRNQQTCNGVRRATHIYTTINFTRLSVTTEVGALYGCLICGWLGVVAAWKADLNCKL